MEAVSEESEGWAAVQAQIKDAVQVAHPGVSFTDIWVRPCTSWSGGPMVEVWAVYDGEPTDLGVPTHPTLETRLQDILWNLDVDAAPLTHLVAKSDAKEWRPEGV